MGEGQNGRGRPRDPALEARIHIAALDEYAKTGWSGFTMDAVARRAGVGKAALYLRWPEKQQLLLDSVAAHSQRIEDSETDTGTFPGDVRTIATRLLGYFLDPPGWAAVRLAVDAVVTVPELHVINEQVGMMHRMAVRTIVQRAIDRGELPESTDIDVAVTAMYGTLLMHVLTMTAEERQAAKADPAAAAAPFAAFVLSGVGTPTNSSRE